MFGMFVGVVLNRVSTKSLTMHYLCALLVYGVSECLGLSGILGLFTYGAVLKPPEAFRESVSSISTIVEAYVYLTLGLALHTYERTYFVVSFLVFGSCMIMRG